MEQNWKVLQTQKKRRERCLAEKKLGVGEGFLEREKLRDRGEGYCIIVCFNNLESSLFSGSDETAREGPAQLHEADLPSGGSIYSQLRGTSGNTRSDYSSPSSIGR